ncbi:MAG: GatB/YqeY domain-containing protein [Bacilli bacterium]|nr:GatB/YqeY domain-containing protein [Bacilli bacterium]
MVEKLNKDMIEAMKNKDKEKLAVIRAVKASMDKERIDKKREINDDLLLDVVNREVKMRKESIEEFKKGNREDLIKATEAELEILKGYLPEQLDMAEVEKIIDEIFAEVKPTGQKDMGLVMKEATAKLKGKTDMKEVSNIIRTKLSEL